MGVWKQYVGGSWVAQAGAPGGSGGPTYSVVHLYGPEPRSTNALTATSTGGYVWPGSALSSSTARFRFDLGLRPVLYARWQLIWTPNATGNGMKLIHADDGPTNITTINEQTGSASTTPLNTSVDITTDINALISGGVLKNLGHQVNAGATGPVIFLSRIDLVWS